MKTICNMCGAPVEIMSDKEGTNYYRTLNWDESTTELNKWLYLRPELREFSLIMESILRENDHKSDWQERDVMWLLGRAYSEWCELVDAVQHNETVDKECADVANFIMMVWDVFKTSKTRTTGS
jgi:NTP pyrophosphatase (non-canonical NTP hydrolase)